MSYRFRDAYKLFRVTMRPDHRGCGFQYAGSRGSFRVLLARLKFYNSDTMKANYKRLWLAFYTDFWNQVY
jgi:hypothetical protein